MADIIIYMDGGQANGLAVHGEEIALVRQVVVHLRLDDTMVQVERFKPGPDGWPYGVGEHVALLTEYYPVDNIDIIRRERKRR
jgi:hypothetical protein